MLHRFMRCALAFACAVGASSDFAWHFVDVSSILCDSQSDIQIEIPLDAIPADQQDSPHILTFFRTSTDSVSLHYTLTDSSTPDNRTLDAANVTLRSLSTSSARRLHDVDEGSGELVRHSLHGDPMDQEMDWDVMAELSDSDDVAPRRLGGFRRRASSLSGPRRRSSPAAAPATSPAAGTETLGQQRRRAPSSVVPGGAAAQHRRRQAAASTAPASSWGNRHDPRAGSYGYSSNAALNHNYGGRPPVSTGYGYSGAGAYRANSGAQIAMAAGVGVLAGVGASYAWSRLHHLMTSSSGECWAGDQHYENCAECRLKHSPTSDCANRVTPMVDLARDDLMNSGFVPSNVTGPLRLLITEVLGADFTAEKLCPPTNWTENVSGNASGNISGNFSALFVKLTRLASVPAVDEEDPAVHHGHSAVNFVIVAALAACCCAGCVALGMRMGSFGGDDPSKQGAQVQFPPSAAHPAAHYPAAQFPAQLPASHFHHQPYPGVLHSGYPQPPAAPYRPGQLAVV
mmetsp:Transcript_114078/g.285385  ORF Transcript_114078/g.285385 Transcript_114078/m.285385 type:complete len:514 (-) Transcript_114078:334-1875(-)